MSKIFFQPFTVVRNFLGRPVIDPITGRVKKTRNFNPGQVIRDSYGREYRADVTGALRRMPSAHEQPRNYTLKRLTRLLRSKER